MMCQGGRSDVRRNAHRDWSLHYGRQESRRELGRRLPPLEGQRQRRWRRVDVIMIGGIDTVARFAQPSQPRRRSSSLSARPRSLFEVNSKSSVNGIQMTVPRSNQKAIQTFNLSRYVLHQHLLRTSLLERAMSRQGGCMQVT
jgi:hypothetical protein